MTSRRRRAALAATVLGMSTGATACVIEGEQPLGGATSPIINGTYNTGDTAVPAIFLQNAAGDTLALCTGSLISPTIVMTAAHCVHPSSGATRWTVYFGSRISGDPVAIASIPVIDYTYHPDWRANNLAGGHDIALLKIAQAPPAAVTPIPYNTKSMAGREGLAVRLVGFGNSSGEGDGSGAGIKRQGTAVLDDAQNFVLYYTPSPNNTCQGDSGGPTFATIDGTEVVVGITSFGPQGCGAYGASTRVDTYAADFIAPWVAANEGPSCGPDGACLPSCPGHDPDCPALSTGARCNVAEDCVSQLCLTAPDEGTVKFCTALCDPAAAGACPDGMACVPAGATDHVCIYAGPSPGALGGACAEQGDCATGLCIGVDGAMICSKFCSDAAACGTAFDCAAAGESMVCIPKDAQSGDGGDGGDDGGDCAVAPARAGGPGAGGFLGALGVLALLGAALTTCGRARRASSPPDRRRPPGSCR